MKKTIIAASLTALAMGPAFAAINPHNEAMGKETTYDEKSDNQKGKLTGGWYYQEENVQENTDLNHGSVSTNITFTGGSFDELIGGNHIKQPTYKEGTHNVTIGDTKVTMTGGSVEYFIGGSKANNSDKTTLITGDVTAVISGGSIGNQSSTSEYPVSAIGGSYVKSTGNPGEAAIRSPIWTTMTPISARVTAKRSR